MLPQDNGSPSIGETFRSAISASMQFGNTPNQPSTTDSQHNIQPAHMPIDEEHVHDAMDEKW